MISKEMLELPWYFTITSMKKNDEWKHKKMPTEVNDQGNLNLSLERDKVNVDFEAKIQKKCMMYLKICLD